MRMKHGSIALILIQLFVISAIVGALSPFARAPPVHDLLVYDWKLHFTSEPNETAIVNTTVLNNGGLTERDILVKLFVNETEVDSETITTLHRDESVTVSLSWTPETEGKYNVTTYVVPVNGENDVENNVESAYSWVRTGKIVTVDTQGDFSTITEAIGTTNLEIYYGDATIWVASGTYSEADLLIQNSLSSLTLLGEDRNNTIVDGATIPDRERGFLVDANNVTITGFCVKQQPIAVELRNLNGKISGNTFENNQVDVKVVSTAFNIISNNNILGGISPRYGVHLRFSNGNIISDNTISQKGCGIFLDHASNNIISNNNVTDIISGPPYPASGDGITLVSSSNNSIIGNTISNCISEAIDLIESSNTSITRNILTGSVSPTACDWGIVVDGTNSTCIVENTVREFNYGLVLMDHVPDIYPNNTVIHHNNFIDNRDYQAKIYGSYNTAWNSSNLVGNYWSDYNGTDTDGDGIGDTPYEIDENNQDDYPLMWKWFPGDLDGDGDVDDDDFDIFSDAYGYQMGDPNYNPLADLDYDGDVDRYDYSIFAANFGKSAPY